MEILGIDIGGTGIKGGMVNIDTGEMISERFRLDTPKPAEPDTVSKTAAKVIEHFNYNGPVGCGFPAIIKNGVALSAANIDKQWIGTNAEQLIEQASGSKIYACNDADLAGLAEMRYGSGKGLMGTVLLITIGTGLGSALFTDGKMVRNSELGHLYLKDMDVVAEQYAAASARKRDGLKWEEWAVRFNVYLALIDRTLCPDTIILGGGGSKKFDNYAHLLESKASILPAKFLNNAGIIGAAAYAHEQSDTASRKLSNAV